MPICVITAIVQKIFPCSIKSWRYIDDKIAQFFNCPFILSCLLHIRFCKAWFSVGFDEHPGHFNLWGASPRYPSSASTLLSNSSNQWAKPLHFVLMSGYLPAGYGPLTHTIFPAGKSTPILYPNPHCPLNLNKEKRFPGMAGHCWGMRTLVPWLTLTLMRQSFRLPHKSQKWIYKTKLLLIVLFIASVVQFIVSFVLFYMFCDTIIISHRNVNCFALKLNRLIDIISVKFRYITHLVAKIKS
jgi:hypothetical protein